MSGTEQEHPHDTEDLIRLVLLTRQELGWDRERLAASAGITEADVALFEAQRIVPAKPLALRFLEVMGVVVQA